MIRCLTLVALPTLMAIQSAAAGDKGFKTIFNGKDLSGWDGDTELWSVKDGVIHGETTPEKKANGNTFLIWEGGTTKDYELRLSFRCNATNTSGIQYRSTRNENARNKWVVRGRTCLVGEKAVWGKDGKEIKETLITAEEYEELFKLDKWNDVIIKAKGNHIQHYMNGRLVLDFVDGHPKALLDGVLALQLHAGAPMFAEFKDIRIKKLK